MSRGAVVGGLAGMVLMVGLVSVPAGGSAAVTTSHPTERVATRTLPVIKGVVRDDATIRVRPHKTPHGRYRIVVRDSSTHHNWHITGPGGIDFATTVKGTGRWVWRAKLVKGTYDIVCDPHKAWMRTTLKVT